MKICIINPNSSLDMTEHIRRELLKLKSDRTELEVVCPVHGPDTLECAVDEVYAIPEMLKLVKKAEEEDYDAVVIACFSDPGLEAAKELVEIPVVGIGEASIHAASMMGARFSIVTPVRRRIPTRIHQALHRISHHSLASVRSLDLSVAQSESDPALTIKKLIDVVRLAVEYDGAEVIVLGCAGMAGYTKEIEQKFGVIVIDPCAVALKFAEGFAEIGLRHSKIGHFSPPPIKTYR